MPEGGRDVLRRVGGVVGNEDLVEKAFDLREYETSDRLEVGDMRVRFHEVPHFLETHALSRSRRPTAAGASRSSRLAPVRRDSPSSPRAPTARARGRAAAPGARRPRGHLTPAEAGDHARRANARRLVITHISDELDELWARDEAAKAFGGPVDVAREGGMPSE